MKPRFFATPEKFRAWLAKNHGAAPELLVGFYKKGCGKPSIDWPQSVDEALCFGWIDGVRRNIGADSYSIRFTPRRARSVWSSINIRRVKAMSKEGRMSEAGLAAFQRRSKDRSAIYAYEQRDRAKLTPAETRIFKAEPDAWAVLFQARAFVPPEGAVLDHSARKPETREKRLARIIAMSAAGEKR